MLSDPRVESKAMSLPVLLLLSLQQPACVSRPAKLPAVAERWAAARARAHAIACEKLVPNIPGFALAVAVDGRVVWSEAFGYASLETHRPATAARQFRIGGVPKSLTDDAAAPVDGQGKRNLDAPVQRFVPAFPEKGCVTTTLEMA